MFKRLLLLLLISILLSCRNDLPDQLLVEPVQQQPTLNQLDLPDGIPPLREDWIYIASTDAADGIWMQKSTTNPSIFWEKLVFQSPQKINNHQNIGAILSLQKADCDRETLTTLYRVIYNWDGQSIEKDDLSAPEVASPRQNTIGKKTLDQACGAESNRN